MFNKIKMLLATDKLGFFAFVPFGLRFFVALTFFREKESLCIYLSKMFNPDIFVCIFK